MRRAAALAFLLALGCEAAEDLPSAPAPEAVFGGCVEFLDDACALEGPSTLTVWLDVHAATPLQVRIDGQAVPSTGRVVQGGVRLSIDVPQGAQEIRVDSVDASWDPPVTMPMTWRSRPKLDGMSAEEIEAFANTSSGWAKLRTLELLRSRNQRGKRGPEFRGKELAHARELGAVRHQVLALASGAHFHTEGTRDLARARAALDELEPLTATSPLAQTRWSYYSGMLAYRTGDFGAALELFQAAHLLGERLNYGLSDVLEMEAGTLAELGRDTEARALIPKIAASRSTAACENQVRMSNNIAWVQIVLAAAGREHEDPRPVLYDGLERNADCPDAWRHTAVLLDLAMIELEYGNPTETLGWLAHIDVPASLTGWVEEIRYRAAVDGGHVDDLPTLLKEPRDGPDGELNWNRRVRYADLLAAWGFDELAAEAYRDAEARVAAAFEQVGSGGELYLSGRSASLEGLVSVLIDQGRLDEAACAVRLGRARELARFDRTARLGASGDEARDDWQRKLIRIEEEQRVASAKRSKLFDLSIAERRLAEARLDEDERATQSRLDEAIRALGLEPTPRSCADLRSASAGEVILTAYSAPGQALVFANSEAGVEVSTRDDLSALDSLAGARQISIVEVGGWNLEPLHALPWRDQATLLDVAPIAYSLDLPPRPESTAPRGKALLVANTRGDLPEAEAEADAVGQAIDAKGWRHVELRGQEATREALVDQLASVDLLHYAGHGVREGRSGWASALLLADDERLGIRDVFTLRDVPRGVVLTGCETASANPDTVGGGLNIGRAFVLSGSDWVIAADTEIADRYAAAMGAAVHRSSAESGPGKLRDAVLELRADDPDLPWKHFRVVTP